LCDGHDVIHLSAGIDPDDRHCEVIDGRAGIATATTNAADSDHASALAFIADQRAGRY
jgi:hypothetical protein